MKKFKYKARDEKGKLVKGEVEASDAKQAVRLVRRRGLVVVSIDPILDFAFFNRLKNRTTSADITNLTRQLATMINAGLPLTEALLILRSQSTGYLETKISNILADVEEGESLSSAMGKHPELFSKTYIALIKSGEVGGVLEKVLIRLADNLEKREEFRGKVKSAMIYPIIVVVGMVIVGLVMILVVIPRLTSLYDQFEADLPASTKFLIFVSDTIGSYWPIVLMAIGVGIWAFVLYRRTKEGRRKIDAFIFKIPIFGELQRLIILTEVTRTLSLMIGSGVSIIEALNITSEIVGNKIIADALEDISKSVEKGFPLAFAFSRHGDAFPFLLSQMVAVGEETGQMDEVLTKVSRVFEVESDQKVKALTSAIEPIILIILGVGVAFLVVSIILPIYNLTTKL